MAEGNGVLIVAEAAGSDLRPVSLELITAGRQLADALGGGVTAVIGGMAIEDAAQRLASAGADKVLVADGDAFADVTAGVWTALVTQAIERTQPATVLIPGTTAGRDYAPRVAARLGVGLAADCVELAVEDGAVVAVRPVLGGRVQTAVKLAGNTPQMATVRAGSFERATGTDGNGSVEPIDVPLSDDDTRVKVLELVQEAAAGQSLEGADRIVSGGRGLKEPDQFKLVEDLAAALGAAVGASRAVVDAGWRPHSEQVGQTGQTVSPRLYVAVGISGAVQHLVGMQSSDYIVAINRDPDAPIFKIASFGIVGDLFEVVPAVIDEVKAARA